MTNGFSGSSGPHVSLQLAAYHNGTLSSDERRRVRTHLETCPLCRAESNDWSAIASASRSAFGLASGIEHAAVHPMTLIFTPHLLEPFDSPALPQNLPAVLSRKGDRRMSTTPKSLSGDSPRIDRRTFAPAALLVVVIAVMIGAIGIRPPGNKSEDRPSIPAVALSSDASPAVGPATAEAANNSNQEASNETAVSGVDCTNAAGDLSRIDLAGPLTTESVVTWPDASISESGPATSTDWQLLPTGPQASAEEIAAITSVVEQFVACTNADKPAEASSLFTDDYWRRMHNVEKPIDPDDPFSFVPLGGQPNGGPFVIPSIEDVIQLDDGRIGAGLHPSVSASLNFGYYVFVNESGTWRIDEVMTVFKRNMIELAVDDAGFSESSIYVTGGKTDLNLTNNGTVTHSIVIPELNIRIEVAPGESAAQTIVYSEAVLPFYSDMPGDTAPGFTGEVIIDIDGDGDGDAVGQATPEGTPYVDDSNGFIVPVLAATIEVDSPSIYTPDTVSLIANRDAQLVLTNTNPWNAGNFTIDALGINVDIPVGESVTVTINAEPGIYVFYCNQPFSAINGMYGTLLILDPNNLEGGVSP